MRPLGPASLYAVAAALLIAPACARAQDVDARTMAFLYDAATGEARDGSPVDRAALAEMRKALQAEGLLTQQRVATPEPDIVEVYGRALLLGPRARQFLAELAEVRNAAIRRDRVATAAAIERLFAKAGRSKPDAAQMDKYVDAVIGAGGDEGPPETARRRVEKPGRTVEITDAKRAGLLTVEVTERPASGPESRTVVVSERKVRPDAAGRGLEERATPVRACTVTADQAAERRNALNGTWRALGGSTWEISGSGETIVLAERRADGRLLTYNGTYKLGRVQATHPVGHPDDIGKELPAWVRAGLVGKTAFVVRLDDCGERTLQGTWESRHVTYSPAFQSISRIHDPYDLSLNLSRGALKLARGGRFPDEGP